MPQLDTVHTAGISALSSAAFHEEFTFHKLLCCWRNQQDSRLLYLIREMKYQQDSRLLYLIREMKYVAVLVLADAVSHMSLRNKMNHSAHSHSH